MDREKIKYTKTLLDKAAEKYGSYYALSKETGIDQGVLSRWKNGKEKLPLKHVQYLGELAGVNWTVYYIEIMKEQQPDNEKGRAVLERLGKAAAAGAAAMLLFSYSNGFQFATETIANNLSYVYIVLSMALAVWVWVRGSHHGLAAHTRPVLTGLFGLNGSPVFIKEAFKPLWLSGGEAELDGSRCGLSVFVVTLTASSI